jgi:hypothetical protein
MEIDRSERASVPTTTASKIDAVKLTAVNTAALVFDTLVGNALWLPVPTFAYMRPVFIFL